MAELTAVLTGGHWADWMAARKAHLLVVRSAGDSVVLKAVWTAGCWAGQQVDWLVDTTAEQMVVHWAESKAVLMAG
jgi:hypothetical protein